jgi:FMN phosphatase YigB (HAD superfamily)
MSPKLGVLFDLDKTIVDTERFKRLSTDASIVKMQSEAILRFNKRIPRILLEDTMNKVRKEKGSNYEQAIDETMKVLGPQMGITDQIHLDIIANAGITAHQIIKDAYFAFLFPDAIDSLSNLRQQGFDTYVGTAGITHKQLNKTFLLPDINHLFRMVFVTSQFLKETGASYSMDQKTPEFFIWIAKRLSKQPNELLMVGDSYPNDIVAAKNAGLWTAHLIRGGAGSDTKGEHADKVIEDLEAVVGFAAEIEARINPPKTQ